MKSCDIIILTDERYDQPAAGHWYVDQLLHEEALLQEGLRRRGLTSRRVAWSRPDVDWSLTRAAVFRSTWDYFERFSEFSPWLDRTAAQTRLFNCPELLRWNIDKHYLRDLAERGVNLPETEYLEPGDHARLGERLAARSWREAIIKPSISGAARHTYRLNENNTAEIEPVVTALLREESMILQPFLPSVLTEGELSLIVIGGRCTHAVRKVAKRGDFRVQDDHGGTVHAHAATAAEIAFAETTAAACPSLPLYARVDAVLDETGALSLMELEVVEPELFFRFHPPAADALAAEIAVAL